MMLKCSSDTPGFSTSSLAFRIARFINISGDFWSMLSICMMSTKFLSILKLISDTGNSYSPQWSLFVEKLISFVIIVGFYFSISALSLFELQELLPYDLMFAD